MKDIEIEETVEDCTAQAYYDAIYASDAAIRTFHSKVNRDPAAVVGPWGADGQRSVQFVMPMNVPAMLKKVIGMDNVPVTETQQVEWLDGKSAFRVVSEPQLNLPGANKFTTSGFLEVRSLPNGTCQVRAFIRCSAAMPWPMQATVEGLMATEAVASIRTFLEFCKQQYADWRAAQQQQLAEDLLQPERPAAPRRAASSAGEQFYDAVEDDSELSRGADDESEEEDRTSVVPYQPPRLEDVIVDSLRQIQASTAATAATLRSLEELIRNMDDNMQVVRDKLVGPRRPPRAAAAPATSSAARGAGAAPAAWPQGGAVSYITSYMAATSLLCMAGAFVYVRYRLGAGGSSGK